MSKYADVERMLRIYSDGEYKMHQLRKEHRYAVEAMQEVTGLKSMHYGTERVQGGTRRDPVHDTYEHEIQAYEQKAQSAMQTIRQIQNMVDNVKSILLELPKEEAAIIEWKYRERLPEKYIVHKLKKELNYPICERQLRNIIREAHEKLAEHFLKLP